MKTVISRQSSVISRQSSVIVVSRQSSVVSHQSSVISLQLLAERSDIGIGSKQSAVRHSYPVK